MKANVRQAVVVSDLHAGCRYGLCPPRIRMDGGSVYKPEGPQALLWKHWRYFWREIVPAWLEGAPWVLVLNGDTLDGRHHGSVTQWSQNLSDQQHCAVECLRLPLDAGPAAVYVVRGTESHVGPSAEQEEQLAVRIGAIPINGQYSQSELWLRVGAGIAHITHTIETSGSPAYETTALCREYVDACAEAAKWGIPRPDWCVRSHRHRHCEVRVPTKAGRGTVIVTPGWQLRTPWVYRTRGGRTLLPQIGGSIIVAGKDEYYSRSYVREVEREAPQVVIA